MKTVVAGRFNTGWNSFLSFDFQSKPCSNSTFGMFNLHYKKNLKHNGKLLPYAKHADNWIESLVQAQQKWNQAVF